MIFGASASLTNSNEDMMNSVVAGSIVAGGAPQRFNYNTINTMRYFEPGVYAEYTYNLKEKFSLVLGLRGDWMGATNSNFGGVATDEPKPSASYKPKEYFALTSLSYQVGYYPFYSVACVGWYGLSSSKYLYRQYLDVGDRSYDRRYRP